MSKHRPLRIASVSGRQELADIWRPDLHFDDSTIVWERFAADTLRPKSGILARAASRLRLGGPADGEQSFAKRAEAEPFDMAITHDPLAGMRVEEILAKTGAATRRLAWGFHLDELPGEDLEMQMQRAFETVDALTVFTQLEQKLYADTFKVDRKKLLHAAIAVAAPLSAPPSREIEGLYFAAPADAHRDDETLFDAARRSPEERFVVIGSPQTPDADSLRPPANMTVLQSVSDTRAVGILYHAEAVLLPLLSGQTPRGLVPLVSAMQLGKAMIVTDALGVREYVNDGKSGLLTPARDARALTSALDRLKADPSMTSRLGDEARTHAEAHCSPKAAEEFFSRILEAWFG